MQKLKLLTNKFRIRANKPLSQILANHVFYYPTPSHLNYNWSFGSLVGLFFALQIVTGIFLLGAHAEKFDLLEFFEVVNATAQVDNSTESLTIVHDILNGKTVDLSKISDKELAWIKQNIVSESSLKTKVPSADALATVDNEINRRWWSAVKGFVKDAAVVTLVILGGISVIAATIFLGKKFNGSGGPATKPSDSPQPPTPLDFNDAIPLNASALPSAPPGSPGIWTFSDPLWSTTPPPASITPSPSSSVTPLPGGLGPSVVDAVSNLVIQHNEVATVAVGVTVAGVAQLAQQEGPSHSLEMGVQTPPPIQVPQQSIEISPLLPAEAHMDSPSIGLPEELFSRIAADVLVDIEAFIGERSFSQIHQEYRSQYDNSNPLASMPGSESQETYLLFIADIEEHFGYRINEYARMYNLSVEQTDVLRTQINHEYVSAFIHTALKASPEAVQIASSLMDGYISAAHLSKHLDSSESLEASVPELTRLLEQPFTSKIEYFGSFVNGEYIEPTCFMSFTPIVILYFIHQVFLFLYKQTRFGAAYRKREIEQFKRTRLRQLYFQECAIRHTTNCGAER